MFFPLSEKKALEKNSKSILDDSFTCVCVCLIKTCVSFFKPNFSSFFQINVSKAYDRILFFPCRSLDNFSPLFSWKFSCQSWGEFKLQFSSSYVGKVINIDRLTENRNFHGTLQELLSIFFRSGVKKSVERAFSKSILKNVSHSPLSTDSRPPVFD